MNPMRGDKTCNFILTSIAELLEGVEPTDARTEVHLIEIRDRPLSWRLSDGKRGYSLSVRAYP